MFITPFAGSQNKYYKMTIYSNVTDFNLIEYINTKLFTSLVSVYKIQKTLTPPNFSSKHFFYNTAYFNNFLQRSNIFNIDGLNGFTIHSSLRHNKILSTFSFSSQR